MVLACPGAHSEVGAEPGLESVLPLSLRPARPVLAASSVIMATGRLPSPQPQHLPMTSYCLWDKFQTLPVVQAKNLAFALDTPLLPLHPHPIHQKPLLLHLEFPNLTPSRHLYQCHQGPGPQQHPAGFSQEPLPCPLCPALRPYLLKKQVRSYTVLHAREIFFLKKGISVTTLGNNVDFLHLSTGRGFTNIMNGETEAWGN